MTSLVYVRRTALSGKAVAEALGINGYLYEDGPRLPPGEVISWGARVRGAALNGCGDVPSSKYEELCRLRDNGIPVPLFSRDPDDLSFPKLGRKDNHMGGTDVVLALQQFDVTANARDFWTQYIPKEREYRLHVFRGKVIYLTIKKMVDPERHRRTPHLWSYKYGFRFIRQHRPLKRSRYDAAENAVESLGLDFGAVDMIIGEDGREYVLEVNTGPGLAPGSAAAYVEAIRKDLDIPREQVDLSRLSCLRERFGLDN